MLGVLEQGQFETKTHLSPEHLGPPLHEEVWIVP